MPCYERLQEQERTQRRTIAEALEVLRQNAGFKDTDRAKIRIGPLQLPSGEVASLVCIFFESPNNDTIFIVSLLTSAEFRGKRLGHSEDEIFDIFQLDEATFDDSGNVRLRDGTHVRAVKVIRVTHLTPEQLEIYRIAEQRLNELAPWDERALADAFRELSELDLGFSLEVTGFSQGEIDFRIEGFAANQAKSTDDTTDTVPAVGATAVTRHGDQWQLERHRILCGTALQSDTFAALMARRRATAVITDPPYNVPIQGHVSGKGRVHHREFAMATGEMSSDEFSKFLRSFLAAAIKHVAAGALLYIFMDWRHCAEIQIAATELGLELKNVCIWVKSNAGMGSFYRSQHEFVFIFKHGTAAHRNNVELGRHGRFRTNVWQYPGFNSFERRGEEGSPLWRLANWPLDFRSWYEGCGEKCILQPNREQLKPRAKFSRRKTSAKFAGFWALTPREYGGPKFGWRSERDSNWRYARAIIA
jgi:DNA methylase